MTNEVTDTGSETAVSQSPTPPEDTQPQDSPRSEWVKFGALVLVLVGILGVVALSRSLIFGRIVPAIMGGGSPAAPLAVPTVEPTEIPVVPAAAPTGEVFLPALTTDTTDTSAQPTVTEVVPVATEAVMVETAVPQPITHTVQPGENLTKIAQQYNIPVQAIMQANNLLNPNYIQAGQVLVIPAP